MQKYQPEFIEAEQIISIFKSCVPFFEEKAGRYWLDRLSPDNHYMGHSQREIRKLIAQGLNSIEETGSLEREINHSKERIRTADLIQTAYIAKDEYNSADLFEKISPEDLWNYEGVSVVALEMELALFMAWQKSLKSVPAQKPVSMEGIAVKLIPKTIMDIANANLIQETEEGSHIFINQKGSLEELKRILVAQGLALPQNKDIERFIWQVKDGVAKPYDPSHIRRVFPKSVRACNSAL